MNKAIIYVGSNNVTLRCVEKNGRRRNTVTPLVLTSASTIEPHLLQQWVGQAGNPDLALVLDNQSETIAVDQLPRVDLVAKRRLYSSYLDRVCRKNFTTDAWLHRSVLHAQGILRKKSGVPATARVLGITPDTVLTSILSALDVAGCSSLRVLSFALLQEMSYKPTELDLESCLVVCLQPDGAVRHTYFYSNRIHFSRLLSVNSYTDEDLVTDVLGSLLHLSKQQVGNQDQGMVGIPVQRIILDANLEPRFGGSVVDSLLKKLHASAELDSGGVAVSMQRLPEVLLFVEHVLKKSIRGNVWRDTQVRSNNGQEIPLSDALAKKEPAVLAGLLLVLLSAMFYKGWQASTLFGEVAQLNVKAGKLDLQVEKLRQAGKRLTVGASEVHDVVSLYDMSRYRSLSLSINVLLSISSALLDSPGVALSSIEWGGDVDRQGTLDDGGNEPGDGITRPSGARLLEQSVLFSLSGNLSPLMQPNPNEHQLLAEQMQQSYATYLQFLDNLQTQIPLADIQQVHQPFGLSGGSRLTHSTAHPEKGVDSRFELEIIVVPGQLFNTVDVDANGRGQSR